MKKREITQERLRELLDYIPDTGIFVWKVDRCQNAKAGSQAGCLTPKGSITIEIDHKSYPAHCLAWLYYYGYYPTGQLSHDNNIRSDNRIDNLKYARRLVCTLPDRVDGLPHGVYRAGKKFKTIIYLFRKQNHIGVYDTVEEAEEVYLTLKQRTPRITEAEFLEMKKELKIKNSSKKKELKICKVVNREELTQERLQEVLNYNPDTGVFTRKFACRRMRPDRTTGAMSRGGYIYIMIDGVLYTAHRLAWLYCYGHFPKRTLSPRNDIRSDIRIKNWKYSKRSKKQAGEKKEVLPQETLHLNNGVNVMKQTVNTTLPEVSNDKILTQQMLEELLNYNPNTGIFTWKVNRGPRSAVGSVAGNLNEFGYIRICINGKKYHAHKLAYLYFYGEYPKHKVYHSNGIHNDNKIVNLVSVNRNTSIITLTHATPPLRAKIVNPIISKRKKPTLITQKRLKELLNYNWATGEFTWKVDRGNSKAGDKAGSLNGNGFIYIRIDGKSYLGHKLTWTYHYGAYPRHQIYHSDTNRSNNRLVNLTCTNPKYHVIHLNGPIHKSPMPIKDNISSVSHRVVPHDNNLLTRIQMFGKNIAQEVSGTVDGVKAAYTTNKTKVMKIIEIIKS